MRIRHNARGFEVLDHKTYPETGEMPLAVQSSVSDSLWIGEHWHLNRQETAKLVDHLQSWLKTGSLYKKRRP